MILNRQQRRALAKAKPPPVSRRMIHVDMKHNGREMIDVQLDPMLQVAGLTERPDDVAWNAVVLRLAWGRAMERDHFSERHESIDLAFDAMYSITENGVLTDEQYKIVQAGLAACNEMQSMLTANELRNSLQRALRENQMIFSE